MTGERDQARPDAAARRFVVLGFPRSGTTLLRRLLDAHPQISCPPETNLLSACGRFLQSSPSLDGLSIGVLSGLAFSGIDGPEVLESLRRLVFGLHEKIAGEKSVWVEKTAFDIFYLDEIEQLLAGHCRFICVVRNPLDVIVSVKDLVDGMDQILPELHVFVRRHPSLSDAFAEAWIDRMTALRAFMARRPDDCLLLRYEDLVADPPAALERLTGFMGVASAGREMVEAAFAANAKVGLGDWNTYATSEVGRDRVERWRTALAPSIVARLAPRLEPLMRASGYEPPRTGPPADPQAAVRMYGLAKQFVQNMGRRG